MQGGYLRVCRKSFGQSSGTETNCSREFFPRVFGPAAQLKSPQVNKSRKKKQGTQITADAGSDRYCYARFPCISIKCSYSSVEILFGNRANFKPQSLLQNV
jgi:hypothetical protein